MIPKDVESEIVSIYKSLDEMTVDLSPQPQTEGFSYIHETVAEIHRHSSFLTDLIVKVSRWKARIDYSVEAQKQQLERTYNTALVAESEGKKKRAAADRKASASLASQEDSDRLLQLKEQQLEVWHLLRALQRKEVELKGKSIDLKLQQKVMEMELKAAPNYGSGMGAKEEEVVAPDPSTDYDQTPTSADLSLSILSTQDEKSESTPSVGVEERTPPELEGLSPVQEGCQVPEDPDVIPAQGYVVTEVQDLDELLQGIQNTKSSDGKEIKEPQVKGLKLDPPSSQAGPTPKLMGDVEDFSDLLESI